MADTKAPSYLRKITPKDCQAGGKDAESCAIAADGDEVAILRIGGRISGSETGKTAISEYVKFKGDFEAINAMTGQHYRSQALIVPAVAEQLLCDLSADGSETVQFGLDITVMKQENERGGWKFRYGVRSLMSPKVKDALSQLMDSFDTAIPLLSATKPDKKAKK